MTIRLCRIIDHQNKSAAFREALADAGYLFTDRELANGTRFILADADWRPAIMDNAAERTIPVFLYPHAARPMVQYDGPVKPNPVRCMFTHAEGGLELMKRINYPYPVEVTGWAFSEVRPFRPVGRIRRVCFAPIHPNGNGYLHAVDKDLNRRTYEVLYDWCFENRAELSIRYIGTQEQCGLDGVAAGSWVEWHKGKKNNSSLDMETADLVVAHQTFAYISVALGIPTVMMGEDVPPRTGNTDAGFRYVDHWDDYKDYLMYPLDILNGDPDEVINKAIAGCSAVEDWKYRFIGKPFDGPAFVKKLESYL